MPSLYLVNAATATGTYTEFEIKTKDSAVYPLPKTIHASLEGTGAVSATVIIEVSNTGKASDWLSDSTSTITLTGTNSASGGVVLVAPWQYIRVNISALSGTGAKIDVVMGV